MKKIRHLTIHERNATTPYILLQGKWLAKAGFSARDKVIATISGDTIVITKVVKKE